APRVPALADRQRDVAQRIADVTARGDSSRLTGAAPDNVDDPNWRGRATAAVVKAQEQLAAMPQYLTRAREEAAALRQAAERVEMARREASAAPADRRATLEQAARQAEQERREAERHFRSALRPVLAASAPALSTRLA